MFKLIHTDILKLSKIKLLSTGALKSKTFLLSILGKEYQWLEKSWKTTIQQDTYILFSSYRTLLEVWICKSNRQNAVQSFSRSPGSCIPLVRHQELHCMTGSFF